MGAMTDAFGAAFRDYNTDGVPTSGPYKPIKSVIRQIGAQLDAKLPISVTDAPYNALPGLGDQTAKFALAAAAAVAAGRPLYIPGGTQPYIIVNWQPPSNLVLVGDGDSSVLRRPAGTLLNAPIAYFYQKSGVVIRDVKFDGDAANQVTGGHNLQFSECWNIQIDRVTATGAKTVAGGYGAGIVFVDGKDADHNTSSAIRNINAFGNDASGLFIDKARRLTVQGGNVSNNGRDGVFIGHYAFPPEFDVQQAITVADMQAHGNGTTGTGSGITVLGNIVGGTPSQPFYDVLPAHSRQIIITGNNCSFNRSYGIAYQGAFGTVSGNTCYRNGSSVNNGNFLFNAYASTFTGNASEDAAYFGVDAGASWWCTVTGNQITRSGVTSGFGGIDINIGASVGCLVSSNTITQAGAIQTTGIYVSGLDSDGVSSYNWSGAKALIANNIIFVNASSDSAGIVVINGFDFAEVNDNAVYGAAAGKAFVLSVHTVKQRGNTDFTNIIPNSASGTAASASTMIISDVGETFYVSGTTNIANIRTASQALWDGKLRSVFMTNNGSGYDPLNPPSTANGGITVAAGPGSGFVAVAAVSNQGRILGVIPSNYGSGFTSASPQAITFAPPISGTTATGTPVIGCDNQEGRKISLLFQGALTAIDGGNLALDGNFTTTANASILELRGAYGRWFETSRKTV
ncbi:MAG: hypothetical protein J7521_20455 [Caulobacter sp.]|nr:hypothetical protein [Caulobacter sp.]